MEINNLPEEELIYPNCIAFNGTINGDFIDVGGGYIAANILAGGIEEFPLLLIQASLNEIKSKLYLGDKISGIGILKKTQGEFVVYVNQISRILSQEEINKLED